MNWLAIYLQYKGYQQQCTQKIKFLFQFDNFLQKIRTASFSDYLFSSSSVISYILMTQFSQVLQRAEEIFLKYVDEIDQNKIAQISVRRALKKYDVKNLKINNVTPLRAKKMYSNIIPKYNEQKIRYQHGVTTDKAWLENERRLFIWCTLCYLYQKQLEIKDMVQIVLLKKLEDFQFLKQMFPLKELILIKFQIYSLVKKDNKNSGWKIEQDSLLRKLIQQFVCLQRKQKDKTLEWSHISKQFFVKSQQQFFRNAKQCRERWLNYLDPNKTKGKWEKEQDKILLTSVLEKGKKWSKIVEALDGKKNEHMIKNRYKSLIHKKEKTCKNHKIKQNDIIKLILKDYSQQSKQDNLESNLQESQKCDNSKYHERESSMIDQEDQSKSQQDNSSNSEGEIPEQQNEVKPNHFEKRCQTWPIIVQPSNKRVFKEQNVEKNEEEQKENGVTVNQVQICGNKADKQFVSNLFYSVNTPIGEENRAQPNIFENRSPASNIFLTSPFPVTCWTPSMFLVDDQGQQSPMGFGDFTTKARNFTSFIPQSYEKRN